MTSYWRRHPGQHMPSKMPVWARYCSSSSLFKWETFSLEARTISAVAWIFGRLLFNFRPFPLGEKEGLIYAGGQTRQHFSALPQQKNSPQHTTHTHTRSPIWLTKISTRGQIREIKAASAMTEQSRNVQNMFPYISLRPLNFICTFLQTGCCLEEFGRSYSKTIRYENPEPTR